MYSIKMNEYYCLLHTKKNVMKQNHDFSNLNINNIKFILFSRMSNISMRTLQKKEIKILDLDLLHLNNDDDDHFKFEF